MLIPTVEAAFNSASAAFKLFMPIWIVSMYFFSLSVSLKKSISLNKSLIQVYVDGCSSYALESLPTIFLLPNFAPTLSQFDTINRYRS